MPEPKVIEKVRRPSLVEKSEDAARAVLLALQEFFEFEPTTQAIAEAK